MKKFCLLAAGVLALGSATVWAGGSAPVAEAQSYGAASGLYIEGGLGYAWRNWSDMYYWQGSDWGDHDKGGFASILATGYQFNQYFSLELGWVHMTSPSMTDAMTARSSWGSSDGTMWSLYFGGKLQAPIYDGQTYLYGKLAAAYNRNQVDTNNLGTISQNYWSPLFAVGVQRYFNDKFSMRIQYTYIPAYTNATDATLTSGFNVPQSHILIIGFGHKFLM